MKESRFQNNYPKSNKDDGFSNEQDTLFNARRDRLLQQRVNHLEAIFDNLPDAVIVTDTQGRIVSSNRQARVLLGKAPENIAADQWPASLGFFLDDGETYYPGSRMPIVRALQGDVVASEEMVLKPEGGGKSTWISMSAQSLVNPDGDIDGAVVVFRDISYRKQVENSREKHVLRAEALYRLSKTLSEVGDDVLQVLNTAVIHAAEMVGDACVAYLVTETSNRVEIYASYHPNPNSRAILREMMISQSFQLDEGIIGGVIRSGEPLFIPSIAPQQLAAITMPSFSKYVQMIGVESILVVPLKGQKRVLGTLGLSRDWGRPPYTSDEQSFLEDIARRTALAVENCKLFESLRREIADRRLAERALHESEERFRSIFESSALGIKVLDLDGEIIQTNRALQNILGYTAEEMAGKPFTAFIHPEDVPMSKQHLEDLICGRLQQTDLEHRLVHKDGSIIWVVSTFAGVKEAAEDEGYRFIFAMVKNINQNKKIAAELLELKARLLTRVEIERLRLAQDLHDGPMQDLHSAVYQIGGLREKLDSDEKAVLDGARDTILQVITDLRSTAKELRPPTIMDFGLEKAIRSHVEEFKEKHPELNIQLALAPDRQLLSEDIRLALFRIYQQALMNVVRHAEAKKVSVRFMLDAEEVTLDIKDDGKGFVVPARWITLTREGHFGLAGAAERVETLGGTFTVESEPGKGTRLHIHIPSKGGTWGISIQKEEKNA